MSNPCNLLYVFLVLWAIGSILFLVASFRPSTPPRFVLAAPACWLLFSMLGKIALAQHMLGLALPSLAVWSWSVGACLVFVALLQMLAPRWAVAGAIALDAFFSAIFVGDLIYYRYYQDFLSFYLFYEAQQLPSVAGIIPSLVHKTDAWFFCDLPVVVLAAFKWPAPSVRTWRARWVTVGLLGVLPTAGLVAGLLYYGVLSTHLMRIRMLNTSVVRKYALLNYHLYDLYSRLKNAFTPHHFASPTAVLALCDEAAQSVTADSPWRGMARGRNVIMMQLESLQAFVIGRTVNGQEITPFLNELRKSCIYGDVLDQTSWGGSSDGEFLALNGLHPPTHGPLCFLYSGDDYHALPSSLDAMGYHTIYAMPYNGAYFNEHVMTRRYGFQDRWFIDSWDAPREDEKIGWGMSDRGIFRQLLPKLAAGPHPFFCYVETLMGHFPFKELTAAQQQLNLPPEIAGTELGDYLQICRVRDDCMRYMVTQMQEDGLWNNTVLVFFGDHRSRLPLSEIERLRDVPNDLAALNRVPLFIHVPPSLDGRRIDGMTLKATGGQMDIDPTIMHLCGVDDPEALFLGHNLLVAGERPIASRQGYVVESGHKVLALDGTFEIYNLDSVWPVKWDGAKAAYDRMMAEFDAVDGLVEGNQFKEVRALRTSSDSGRSGSGSQ